jgi:hypothetical protein
MDNVGDLKVEKIRVVLLGLVQDLVEEALVFDQPLVGRAGLALDHAGGVRGNQAVGGAHHHQQRQRQSR